MASSSSAQTPADSLLNALRWENRVLLVFSPSAVHPAYEALAAQISAHRDDFLDRDLVFVPVLEEGISLMGTMVLPEEAVRRVRDQFGVSDGAFRVLLIGKDGGVKMEASSPVWLQDVFARIDRMPMRRREMRERGQGQ